MGNKLTTLVTTTVLLFIFILMVSFILTDTQAKESRRLINEFTETVQYKGYITLSQYYTLLDRIPFSNIKLSITQKVNDTLKTANDPVEFRFTDQIMNGDGTVDGFDMYTLGDGTPVSSGYLLGSEGIYRFGLGDEIQVDLYVLDDTVFDRIYGIIIGDGSYRIKRIASDGGVILNTKYM